jgi:hypothetical protein
MNLYFAKTLTQITFSHLIFASPCAFRSALNAYSNKLIASRYLPRDSQKLIRMHLPWLRSNQFDDIATLKALLTNLG